MTTAKYARRLIQRIYEHLRDVYGLAPGATILDPFGGCGLGGLDAMLHGYHFVGVELEERFWSIGQQNIAYWCHKFGPQPGSVTLLQGDSRQLRRILQNAQVGGLVSSPPYANGLAHACEYRDQEKAAKDAKRDIMCATNGQAADMRYGTTPGQLANLPIGACVSSPPYVESVNATSHGIDWSKTGPATGNRQRGAGSQCEATLRAQLAYGSTEGQLGAMPPGNPALVSSPPYEAQASNCATNHGKEAKPQWKAGGIAAREPKLVPGYGETPGNIGNESQETFWSASSQIMAELAALLPPGALAVWILKAFIRQKAVVDFPSDWLKLCQHHGFTLVERIHASLVEHHGEEPTLWGETVQRSTKRSSFFRRLHEKRYPDLAIDHEVVLITVRT